MPGARVFAELPKSLRQSSYRMCGTTIRFPRAMGLPAAEFWPGRTLPLGVVAATYKLATGPVLCPTGGAYAHTPEYTQWLADWKAANKGRVWGIDGRVTGDYSKNSLAA